MKIKICLSILFFGVVLISSAKAQISVGVMGGINFADFALKNAGEGSDIAFRTAYTVGASIDYQLYRDFQISLEPMYLQKNARLNQANPDPDIDLSITYLEIPLLLKAYFGQEIRPYLLAGPSAGFLLNSEAQSVFSGQHFSGSINNVLHKTDLGLVVGGGISFSIGRSTLFFEGQYTFGLFDLSKGGSLEFKTDNTTLSAGIDDKTDARSRGIRILTGLSIPLGRE